MSLNKLRLGLVALLALFPLLTLGAPKADLWAIWDQSNPTNNEVIDHTQWQNFLHKYVVTDHPSEINLVRYADVTDHDKGLLNNYVTELLRLEPRNLQKAEQFAYWVNLYNAATVLLILREYPVSSITKLGSGFFSFGPWNDPIGKIAGNAITLNDIEHRILRPIWQDPRIHFAVNCASMGCPNLSAQAYTQSNSQELLEKSTHAFIQHPRGVKLLDSELRLSSLFDWYLDDFADDRASLLQYLAQYLPNTKAQILGEQKLRITYAYDWALNDAL